MRPNSPRKQISMFIPVSDWRVIRLEAARQRIPMTELCRRWIAPELNRLDPTRTDSQPVRAERE